ncbi:MAG: hypothetical protein FJZ90_03900 [Chloroflexi bacterium]|nr:hypothetical protein [Chloroflexota bacterium]
MVARTGGRGPCEILGPPVVLLPYLSGPSQECDPAMPCIPCMLERGEKGGLTMATYECRETEGCIVFADERLELTFDRRSGRWLSMLDRMSGEYVLKEGGQQASVVVSTGGETSTTYARWQWWSVVDAEPVGVKTECLRYACREGAAGPTLTVHTRQGDWLLDQHYTLVKGAARVARALRIEYQGDGEVLLRGLDIRVPPATLGLVADCVVEAPSYPTKADCPLGRLPIGEIWDRVAGGPGFGTPGWVPGLIGLHNPGKGLALGIWIYDEAEPSHLDVRRGDKGLQVTHKVMLADRFRRGHAVEWKGQYVQVFHRPWLQALEQFQTWYAQMGIRVPESPAWARTARIYELFIGHHPMRGPANKFPEMQHLVDDLPRIKDLGFNAVEIMPHMPFPSYSILDYFDVDSHYGSAEGLKRATARAHELGMRVILDVIIHGVMDQEAVRANAAIHGRSWLMSERLPERHPYRIEHPEWFMQTEFGTPAATYTWAFDHANESWRDFMMEVFKHYVTEYDVDGFRVDALTWNDFPNWTPGLPYRASASIYGSAEMSVRVRHACREIKPDVVFYTETPGPLFMPAYDLVYNYNMQWLYSALLTPISPRGFAYAMAHATERMRAADLGPWLEQYRLAKPKGATTVNHLDSHDSHEWGGLMQYRREAFGEEASRMLFCLCCALGAPLMIFCGAEDGAESFYRKMLHMVSETPALERGDSDYLAIRVSDPDVFAPLRTYGSQVVVPVIHVANKQALTTLSLPIERLQPSEGSYRVIDHMDGVTLSGPDGQVWTRDQLGEVAVPLGPYQARFLEIVSA